jgi:hypothetical protein
MRTVTRHLCAAAAAVVVTGLSIALPTPDGNPEARPVIERADPAASSAR